MVAALLRSVRSSCRIRGMGKFTCSKCGGPETPSTRLSSGKDPIHQRFDTNIFGGPGRVMGGATKAAEREFVRALVKSHPIFTPSESIWLESGKLLAKMRADKGLASEKLLDLHFDVLIALTARSHGARLITPTAPTSN